MKRRRADVKQIPPEERKRREEERQASFRAWWNGLSPEAQRAEIKAGHVRVNLPPLPGKIRKTRKRTVAASSGVVKSISGPISTGRRTST